MVNNFFILLCFRYIRLTKSNSSEELDVLNDSTVQPLQSTVDNATTSQFETTNSETSITQSVVLGSVTLKRTDEKNYNDCSQNSLESGLFLSNFLKQNYFIELNFIFIQQLEFATTGVNNSLINILSLFKLNAKNRQIYYKPSLDHGIDNFNEIKIPEQKISPKPIDFKKVDDFMNKCFDIKIIKKIEKICLSNELQAFILKYKKLINKNKQRILYIYESIKNLVNTKYISLKHKYKLYGFCKNNYLKYFHRIDITVSDTISQLIICNKLKIFAKLCLYKFVVFVNEHIYTSFCFSYLNILNEFFKTISLFNHFIFHKLNKYTKLMKDKLKSEDFYDKKLINDQILIFETFKKSYDEACNEINKIEKEIKDTEIKVKSANNTFMKELYNFIIYERNSNEMKLDPGIKKSTISENIKILEDKQQLVNKKNEVRKSVIEEFNKNNNKLWDFIGTEKKFSDENLFLETSFLQFLKGSLDLLTSFQSFVDNGVYKSIELINQRITMWKKMLKDNEKIYYILYYSIFKTVLYENKILKNCIDNEFKLLKTLDFEWNILEIEKYESILEYQKNMKDIEFDCISDIFPKEMLLKNKQYKIEIFYYQIFMEFKLIKSYFEFLNTFHEQKLVKIKNEVLNFTTFLECLHNRILILSSIKNLYLYNIHNARFLMRNTEKDIQIRRINKTIAILTNKLSKTEEIDNKIKISILNILLKAESTILPVKTHLNFLIDGFNISFERLINEEIHLLSNKQNLNSEFLKIVTSSKRKSLSRELLSYKLTLLESSKINDKRTFFNYTSALNEFADKYNIIKNIKDKIYTIWEDLDKPELVVEKPIEKVIDYVKQRIVLEKRSVLENNLLEQYQNLFIFLNQLFNYSRIFESSLEFIKSIENTYNLENNINSIENDIAFEKEDYLEEKYNLITKENKNLSATKNMFFKVSNAYTMYVYCFYCINHLELYNHDSEILLKEISEILTNLLNKIDNKKIIKLFKNIEMFSNIEEYQGKATAYLEKFKCFCKEQTTYIEKYSKIFEESNNLLDDYFNKIYSDIVEPKKEFKKPPIYKSPKKEDLLTTMKLWHIIILFIFLILIIFIVTFYFVKKTAVNTY
ncbi:hypothetical protein NUSPORA_00788 [Nucleospora cyclopteri]